MATNDLKHVGKTIDTDRKVVVVFREVPGEEDFCLVVDTASLSEVVHDDVVSAVESQAGQDSANFYEYASRILLSNGNQMLSSLHSGGQLVKQPTKNILMTPNSESSIVLDELNKLIAEQTNNAPVVAAPQDGTKTTSAGVGGQDDVDHVINDDELAKNMMAQAIQFEAEAKALREQAYDLDSSLKPRRGRPSKAKSEADA
jgi:hypothetical protein